MTVLMAPSCGNGDLKPNVAEKSVFGFRKTRKFVETSVKNEHMHDIGREKNIFEVLLMEPTQFFSANFNVITVFSQTLLNDEFHTRQNRKKIIKNELP